MSYSPNCFFHAEFLFRVFFFFRGKKQFSAVGTAELISERVPAAAYAAVFIEQREIFFIKAAEPVFPE